MSEAETNEPTTEQKLEVRTQQLNAAIDMLRTLVGKFHALRCVHGVIPPEAIMPSIGADLAQVEAALNSFKPAEAAA